MRFASVAGTGFVDGESAPWNGECWSTRNLLASAKPAEKVYWSMSDSGSLQVVREAYQLSEAQLVEIEARMVDMLEQHPSSSGLATVLLKPDDPMSDFVRTYEASVFGAEGYDFYVGMRPYEQESLFLVTVDLTNKVVAHTKRIVIARKLPFIDNGTILTGIEVVDDRLTATDEHEKANLRDILEFHGIVDMRRCFNLTSNIQTGRCIPVWERPYSLVSYKAVFKITRLMGIDNIFAYMNRGAIRSLRRVGVEFEKLAGRDFHLPTPGEPGRYDLNYEAICIPGTRHNLEAFTKENPERPFTRLIASLEVPLYQLESVGGSVVPLGAVAPAR